MAAFRLLGFAAAELAAGWTGTRRRLHRSETGARSLFQGRKGGDQSESRVSAHRPEFFPALAVITDYGRCMSLPFVVTTTTRIHLRPPTSYWTLAEHFGSGRTSESR
ncbi:uncharacterized protein PSANT_01710 [Moesziomyces antarcticus]|uniref:Uncharacterized protein n=1 Tax=Pseudozyma antarctica TaxID=84753 RepID=A0A5C3FJS6_PSEA2|nr:uncharacterized protein PSANT_01710 [Moesziomyces antarcticus]